MRVFLASTGSGMSKELRDKTVKICRPRYILETFFNGEKSCLEAMSIVGNDNFLLDSGAFSYMNGAKVTLSQTTHLQECLTAVLNQGTRMTFASLGAFAVSQTMDVISFHWLKYKWLRNNASTMSSQPIDTVIFIAIAFYGVVDNIILMIFAQYLIKLILAALDTPFFYFFTRRRKCKN